MIGHRHDRTLYVSTELAGLGIIEFDKGGGRWMEGETMRRSRS